MKEIIVSFFNANNTSHDSIDHQLTMAAAATSSTAAIALVSSDGATMGYLPDKTLKHIFRYSDPRTLLSCERCCTRFCTAIDETMAYGSTVAGSIQTFQSVHLFVRGL
jgi:hypothetical protein